MLASSGDIRKSVLSSRVKSEGGQIPNSPGWLLKVFFKWLFLLKCVITWNRPIQWHCAIGRSSGCWSHHPCKDVMHVVYQFEPVYMHGILKAFAMPLWPHGRKMSTFQNQPCSILIPEISRWLDQVFRQPKLDAAVSMLVCQGVWEVLGLSEQACVFTFSGLGKAACF